ncbi:MAG: hypothetical protein BJ554DRAFT_2844, partial [Olpidium bornovanus]
KTPRVPSLPPRPTTRRPTVAFCPSRRVHPPFFRCRRPPSESFRSRPAKDGWDEEAEGLHRRQRMPGGLVLRDARARHLLFRRLRLKHTVCGFSRCSAKGEMVSVVLMSLRRARRPSSAIPPPPCSLAAVDAPQGFCDLKNNRRERQAKSGPF